jgi:hypothetical protein
MYPRNEPIAVPLRLHRSGAIDCNVTFPVGQASDLVLQTTDRTRLWSVASDKDAYSVVSGEPLFMPSRGRYSGCGSGLNSGISPGEMMSSLNGFSPPNLMEDWANTIRLQLQSDHNPAKVPRDGVDPMVKEIDLYNQLRDRLFCELIPSGVAVTKMPFREVPQAFVATMGGGNTVPVDDDVNAGDILVVDFPMFDGDDVFGPLKSGLSSDTQSVPWGFVPWHRKKGVTHEKRTLVVRSLPHRPHGLTAKQNLAFRRMVNGFRIRSQILGRCTTGAPAGGSADIIAIGNAIGLTSSADMYGYV